MGRTVIAEEGLEYYVKALIDQGKFKVGLIFGQEVNTQKAYVIHLSRTPEPAAEEESNGEAASSAKNKAQKPREANLDSFEDAPVVDHARQVMRSLSGGVTVLGVFVICPEELFQNSAAVSKLRKLASSVDQILQNDSITLRKPFSAERIILHVSSTSQKYTCKTLDISSPSSAPKPADWKFQTAAGSPWIELTCNLLNISFSVGFDKEQATMRAHVDSALAQFNDSIKRSLCLVEGTLRDDDAPLDVTEPREKGRKAKQKQVAEEGRQKTMSVELLLPEVIGNFEKLACLEEISFKGQMCVKAFVHGKASVGEAIEAVREDVVRSLWARCDMHCDSLIGEEQRGEPELKSVLHEPPRRVLAPLPFSPIPASDYLFPGEGPTDSLLSLAELLDLGTLLEGDIQDYWEAVAEPDEILDGAKTPVVDVQTAGPAPPGDSNSALILIAAVIALMAVIVAYVYL